MGSADEVDSAYSSDAYDDGALDDAGTSMAVVKRETEWSNAKDGDAVATTRATAQRTATTAATTGAAATTLSAAVGSTQEGNISSVSGTTGAAANAFNSAVPLPSLPSQMPSALATLPGIAGSRKPQTAATDATAISSVLPPAPGVPPHSISDTPTLPTVDMNALFGRSPILEKSEDKLCSLSLPSTLGPPALPVSAVQHQAEEDAKAAAAGDTGGAQQPEPKEEANEPENRPAAAAAAETVAPPPSPPKSPERLLRHLRRLEAKVSPEECERVLGLARTQVMLRPEFAARADELRDGPGRLDSVAVGREEQAASAARAREALRALADPHHVTLASATEALLLSQTAYRVPTGAEFWRHVEMVKKGTSKSSVLDVYRLFKKRSAAAVRALASHLEAVDHCLGTTHELLGQTDLQLGQEGVSALLAQEEKAEEAESHGIDKKKEAEVLRGIDMPSLPPGWLITRRRGVGPGASDTVHVSVAGTQNPDDCFRDCMFIPTPLVFPYPLSETRKKHRKVLEDGRVKVHAGFLDGAIKVFEQIKAVVAAAATDDDTAQSDPSSAGSRRRPRTTVHFSGHSLGGATATLLAVFFSGWRKRGVRVGHVTTFGAPNLFYTEEEEHVGLDVGTLLSKVDARFFLNDRDIVPRALGSPLVKKLAKLLIKYGVKELSRLTPENSEYLLRYRFASPACLYHIDELGAVAKVEDPAARRRVLSLSVTDCRPAAATHHKISSYVDKLVAALSTASGHDHVWPSSAAIASAVSAPPHPVAQLVFSKKDPSQLSDVFLHMLRFAFETLVASKLQPKACVNYITASNFAALCWCTDKDYPLHLISRAFDCGKYETADGACGAVLGLTLEGFISLMDEACYSDLPWVARIVDFLQRPQHDVVAAIGAFEPQEYAASFGVPLVAGDGEGRHRMEESVLPAVRYLFNLYCTVEEAGDGCPLRSIPLECFEGFVARVEAIDLPPELQLSAAAVTALTRGVVADACPDLRGMLSEAAAAGGTAGYGGGEQQTPTVRLSLKDFTDVVAHWCAEDELAVWRILKEFRVRLEGDEVFTPGGQQEGEGSCSDEEEEEEDVAAVHEDNVHATGACAPCLKKERLRLHEQKAAELERDVHDAALAVRVRLLREAAAASERAALGEEVAQARRRLATAGEAPPPPPPPPAGQPPASPRSLACPRLLQENKNLRKQLALLGDDDVLSSCPLLDRLQARLVEMQHALRGEQKRNRELNTLTRVRTRKAVSQHEVSERLLTLRTGNDVVVANLHRLLLRAREQREQLARTVAKQERAIAKVPQVQPKASTKVVNELLRDYDGKVCAAAATTTTSKKKNDSQEHHTISQNAQQTRQIMAGSRELEIMKRASESEKAKLTRKITEEMLKNVHLQQSLDELEHKLQDKRMKIIENVKATNQGREAVSAQRARRAASSPSRTPRALGTETSPLAIAALETPVTAPTRPVPDEEEDNVSSSSSSYTDDYAYPKPMAP